MNPKALYLILLGSCLMSLRVLAGGPITFTNTNLIIINDSENLPTLASPYPSTIQVTGLSNLVITKVTATLAQLSHTFPSDIHALLCGPRGQSVVLMSEVGGQNKYSVTNLTITLDDDASSSLPVYLSLQSGTFKPTAKTIPLDFSFPAPAQGDSSNYSYTLSDFKNTDPSGTWKLFVIDYGAGDAGIISGGWSLNISVAVPLHVSRQQTNLLISWPTSAGSCILQSSTNLSGPNSWSTEAVTPSQIAGENVVTNTISTGRKYFRLIQ